MSATPKLTIIIPTRDREQYLPWSIRSCLESQYPNLEVLVSDNSSTDATYQVLQTFDDVRLRYIKAPEFLSMSAHWEFALAHVTEGFVSILGDDDAFLPDGPERAMALMEKYQVEAISWKQSCYKWSDFVFAKIQNLFVVNLGKKYSVKSGLQELEKVIQLKESHAVLPWLYSGIVSVKAINKVKEISAGIFFKSKIPDVYSAIVLGSVVEKYLFSEEAFSIGGRSGQSNGSIQAQKSNSGFNIQKDSFLQEPKSIDFESNLEMLMTFSIIIWDCVLKIKKFNNIDVFDRIHPERFIRNCIQELIVLGIYEDNAFKVKEIIRKNKLTIHLIPYVKFCFVFCYFTKMSIYLREWSTKAHLDNQKLGINNIYTASMKHAYFYKKYRGGLKYIFNNIQILLSRL